MVPMKTDLRVKTAAPENIAEEEGNKEVLELFSQKVERRWM